MTAFKYLPAFPFVFVEEQKHDKVRYLVSSLEDLKRLSLKILKERIDYKFYSEFQDIPDNADDYVLKQLNLTKGELNHLLKSLDKKERIFKWADSGKPLSSNILFYQKEHKLIQSSNNIIKMAEDAILENNGEKAFQFLSDRNKHSNEYETFYFEKLVSY